MKMKYRPDIDGLRAIAIVSVLGFHGFPRLLPGGFIGVDIFFVISGFLITGILLTYGYTNFYKRRIIRIFPALVAVLAICCAAAWLTLMPEELKGFGHHLMGGTFFFENLILKKEAGYFDASSESKPLLHLWSLSVEEQFYVFWPLLLLTFSRFTKPIFTIAIAGLISFLISIKLTHTDPVSAFFLVKSRAWELIVGGFCFVLPQQFSTQKIEGKYKLFWTRNSSVLRNALAFSGLALIAISLGSMSAAKPFPGFAALTPVIGTALLLLAGQGSWFGTNLLSLPPMRYLGKISYPLYLAHWPLLSFAYIILPQEELTPTIASCLLLLSIALAVFIYHFIEIPIQRRTHESWSLPTLCVCAGFIFMLGFGTFHSDGFIERTVAKRNPNLASTRLGDGKNLVKEQCSIIEKNKTVVYYCYSDARGKPTLAVWGDSKAEALYWGLVRNSSNQARWMLMGLPSCVPMAGSKRVEFHAGISGETCELANQQALDALINDSNLSTVVLVTAFRMIYHYQYISTEPPGFPADARELGINSAIARLKKAHKRVILVVDNPTIADSPHCLTRLPSDLFSSIAERIDKKCSISYADYLKKTAEYRAMLGKIAARQGVEIFDPTPLICDLPKGICSMKKDNNFLYSYGDHYSDYGNNLVGQQLIAFLNKSSMTTVNTH